MQMPGRKFTAANSGYRYGFNGKEKDNEICGEGNQYDYGFRIYNPRLGRFLSVDPLERKFQMLTPYQYATNRPIDGIDLDGMEYLNYNTALYKFVGGISSNYIFNANDVYITDVELHNVIIGVPKPSIYETDMLVNPADKDSKSDWYGTSIPKPSNRTALFSDWYKQMRNYNSSYNANSNTHIGAANPLVSGASSRGLAILNLAFEITNIIQGIKWATYFEDHKVELEKIYANASAFQNAVNVVGEAVKTKQLPEILLSNPNAWNDLTNYVIDGTTQDNNPQSEYNQLISAWGHALSRNYDDVMRGTFYTQLSAVTNSGGTVDPSKDNTSINVIVPVMRTFSKEVQDAIGITERIQNIILPKASFEKQ